MAWQFHDQIQSLTGLVAGSSDASETGETFQTLTGQWLTDAAKEVINILPPFMLERCAKKGSHFAPATGQNVESGILSVQRALTTSFNAGEVYDCRRISHSMAQKASDADSLEYATKTDPVYYFDPQTNGTAVKVKVLPVEYPSTSTIARVYSVDYPTITYTESEIPNFPDEAINLVLLRASITALEYQLAIEEDVELYGPTLKNLKEDYIQAVNALRKGEYVQPRTQSGTQPGAQSVAR